PPRRARPADPGPAARRRAASRAGARPRSLSAGAPALSGSEAEQLGDPREGADRQPAQEVADAGQAADGEAAGTRQHVAEDREPRGAARQRAEEVADERETAGLHRTQKPADDRQAR